MFFANYSPKNPTTWGSKPYLQWNGLDRHAKVRSLLPWNDPTWAGAGWARFWPAPLPTEPQISRPSNNPMEETSPESRRCFTSMDKGRMRLLSKSSWYNMYNNSITKERCQLSRLFQTWKHRFFFHCKSWDQLWGWHPSSHPNEMYSPSLSPQPAKSKQNLIKNSVVCWCQNQHMDSQLLVKVFKIPSFLMTCDEMCVCVQMLLKIPCLAAKRFQEAEIMVPVAVPQAWKWKLLPSDFKQQCLSRLQEAFWWR